MRNTPLLSLVAGTALLVPGSLAAQQHGTFEIRSGLGRMFSEEHFAEGITGVSLGAGYRHPLNRTLGLSFGLATSIGGESAAADLCAPDLGPCSGETTEVPGTVHFGELDLSVAPFGPGGALRIGAGAVMAWAPGARGTNDASIGPGLRLEGLLPVGWRPRPTLGARIVRLNDRIGVVRWIGTATIGVTW